MTSTFLHEDKTLPPDERVDFDTPDCQACGSPMWLMKVVSIIEGGGATSRRQYECKNCGAKEEIRIVGPAAEQM